MLSWVLGLLHLILHSVEVQFLWELPANQQNLFIKEPDQANGFLYAESLVIYFLHE